MITAIIVDDELMARKALAEFIKIFAKEVEIIGEADSFKTAVVEIQRTQPDLIFLDYEMRDGTGLDVLECFPNLDSKVIFVSGHPIEAHKLFKFDILAFLVKPLRVKELKEAIETYKEEVAKEEKIAKLMPVSEYLFIPQGESVQPVLAREVVRFEAMGNYTTVHLVNGKQMVVTRTLKQVESLLVGHPFFRVHRSHIVHLPFIKTIYKNTREGVELHDGNVIPATVDLLAELQELFPDKISKAI